MPKDEETPIEFYLEPPNISDRYYLYVHFAELQKLEANESRAFNINVNGKLLYGPVIPDYLTSTTIYSTKALTGKSNYSFSIEKLENSTLPPILNAIEFYSQLDFSQSESNEDDGTYILLFTWDLRRSNIIALKENYLFTPYKKYSVP